MVEHSLGKGEVESSILSCSTINSLKCHSLVRLLGSQETPLVPACHTLVTVGRRQMANIRRRGSKWQVQIRRQGFPAITKSFIAREDAVRWSREQERLMDTGDWRRDRSSGCLLADLLSRYEKEVSPRKRSKSDTFHLRQIARHPIARLTVRELSAESSARFRDDRLKSVSGSTVRKEMSLLGRVLNHANAVGILKTC